MHKTPTYVSIDFDFWNENPELAYEEVDNFLKNLKGKIPMIGVMNHQQLLPYVNKSRALKLVNIDYHSDACSVQDLSSLHCGSWVSYVDWADIGTYIWVRPVDSSGCGNCNRAGNDWNRGVGWKKTVGKVRSRGAKAFRGIDLDSIVGVGLCLSPSYIENDLLESTFKILIDKYDIKYKKGTRHENQSVHRRPPCVSNKTLPSGVFCGTISGRG